MTGDEHHFALLRQVVLLQQVHLALALAEAKAVQPDIVEMVQTVLRSSAEVVNTSLELSKDAIHKPPPDFSQN